MDVHGYNEDGAIDVTIDGARMLVPDTMANRHRVRIAEEWEAQGNLIPEYVPRPPSLPNLSRRQMLLALLSIGITEVMVEAQLAAIEDPVEQTAAMIEWRNAGTYQRGHQLVSDLAVAFNLPATQVDALWMWAAQL